MSKADTDMMLIIMSFTGRQIMNCWWVKLHDVIDASESDSTVLTPWSFYDTAVAENFLWHHCGRHTFCDTAEADTLFMTLLRQKNFLWHCWYRQTFDDTIEVDIAMVFVNDC